MTVSLDNNTSYHDEHGFRNESISARTDALSTLRLSEVPCFENHRADATEMDRYVFTRPSLADASVAQKPIVLLTGTWPHATSRSVTELDCTIDRRFIHLDAEAERLAERAGGANGDSLLSAPWVNVLALRYYLLKLLRVIEFFTTIQPPKEGERVCVVADKSDRDDVAIIASICRRWDATCRVQWHGEEPASASCAAKTEQWWRRLLRRLAAHWPSTANPSETARRVVLCGNPRFLDSLCNVLHERGCRVWWLYDHLAVKPLFRWHKKGIEQLTCQDDSPATREREPIELPSLEFRNLQLRDLVAAWLNTRLDTRWAEQQRWKDHIDRHFRSIKPDLLVMDEDATPMKRIAATIAARHGGKSYVVQHGAPVARFGFAPLLADGLFAWGRSTRQQLADWDIPPQRIHVTGSPVHDALYQEFQGNRNKGTSHSAPRILLLATVPPRDDRPDLIEMNMNSRSYAEMIEAAFQAVQSIPGATLVVKPHPRAKQDPVVHAAASRHPEMRIETCKSRSLAEAILDADCVLSCLSSAGIEATLSGIPVIQLVPRGAGRILPHDRWALLGSASTAKELVPLLQGALRDQDQTTTAALGDVFANAAFWGRKSTNVPDAATRIADILLDQPKQSTSVSRTDKGQGRSTAIAGR